jgi:hypothetical protein
VENAWAGRRFALGGELLKGLFAKPRCVNATIPQAARRGILKVMSAAV